MGSLMLCYKTVSPPLIELLQNLMKEDLLKPFILVGGTSLALRLGHRISSDIDLFSVKSFDVDHITQLLRKEYMIQALETAENTIRGSINDIKIDIISHRYPMIEPPVCIDGLRLASLKDIAAMKLNAITNRGSKKDFTDYAELLDHFSHDEMLSFFAEKYTDANIWAVEKSLSYFDDADPEPPTHNLKEYNWEMTKNKILENIRLKPTQ
ncbi:MAG: nucleotidyl transferase AbiEii/AbiGii toxin family protein [Kiritimatiellae bacterium]|nr:nucleotidyl transferase AbiEii/AbiGii toxin family protein [Kiritimatiellia bacterium]